MDERVKQADEAFCRSCGEIIKREAEICVHCGVRQKSSSNNSGRIIAVILAILLGGLGIHKFYLGKIGQGIIYLLFFWTGIPAIIGFVEGLVYLFNSDEEFYAKYGK